MYLPCRVRPAPDLDVEVVTFTGELERRMAIDSGVNRQAAPSLGWGSLAVGVVGAVAQAPFAYFRGDVPEPEEVTTALFSGENTDRFCANCSPHVLNGATCPVREVSAYCKFLIPAYCKYCVHSDCNSGKQAMGALLPAVISVSHEQYQMIKTYKNMALPDQFKGVLKPIHGAMVSQMDDRKHYNAVNSFLQCHLGTLASRELIINRTDGSLSELVLQSRISSLTFSEIFSIYYHGQSRYDNHVEGMTLTKPWVEGVYEPTLSVESRWYQAGHQPDRFIKKMIFKHLRLAVVKTKLLAQATKEEDEDLLREIVNARKSYQSTAQQSVVKIQSAYRGWKTRLSTDKIRQLCKRRKPRFFVGECLRPITYPNPWGIIADAPLPASADSSDSEVTPVCCLKPFVPWSGIPIPKFMPTKVATVDEAAKEIRDALRVSREEQARAEAANVKRPPPPIHKSAADRFFAGEAYRRSILATASSAKADREAEKADLIVNGDAGNYGLYWQNKLPPPATPLPLTVIPPPPLPPPAAAVAVAEDVCPEVAGPADPLFGLERPHSSFTISRADVEDIRGMGRRTLSTENAGAMPISTVTRPRGFKLGKLLKPKPSQEVKDVVSVTPASGSAATTTIQGLPLSPPPILVTKPIDTETHIGSTSVKVSEMRQMWNHIEEFGALPAAVCVESSGDMLRPGGDVIAEGSAAAVKYEKHVAGVTPHMTMLRLETTILPRDTTYLKNPAEQKMVADTFKQGMVNGPISSPITVHKTNNRASAIQACDVRLKPKKSAFYAVGLPSALEPEELLRMDSSGDPVYERDTIHCRLESPAYLRYRAFLADFKKLQLTQDRVDAACNHLFGDMGIEDLHMSKFSSEDVKKAVEDVEVWRCADDMPSRKSFVKLEGILKPGKAARLVQNCGLLNQVINKVAGKILSELVFGSKYGVFYHQSIKERDMDTLANEFVDEFSNPWDEAGDHIQKMKPSEFYGRAEAHIDDRRKKKKAKRENHLTSFVELDQTSMELHETSDAFGNGLLGGIYDLLATVAKCVCRRYVGRFSDILLKKLEYDKNNGLVLKFDLGEGVDRGKMTVKFKNLFLDSGWLLTSLTNFFNEFVGFYCSATLNPQHLLAWSGTGPSRIFHIREGSFDWTFDSIELYQDVKDTIPRSGKIKLRIKVEGDDLGGAVSRLMSDPRNGGDTGLIVKQQEDLGYCAKLVLVVDGRGEMVGKHFKVVDGRLDRNYPPCPDIKRLINKVGTRFSWNDDATADVMQKYSVALLCRGVIECLHHAFITRAETLEREKGLKIKLNKPIILDGYCPTSRLLGLPNGSVVTLQQIKDAYKNHEQASKVYPAEEVQAALIANSLSAPGTQVPFDMPDLGRLKLWSLQMDKWDWQEDVYMHLPHTLRKVL